MAFRPLWPLLCLLVVWVQALDPFSNQPRIVVEDGHLVFQGALNHNITFRSQGGGKIRVNDADLTQLVESIQSAVNDMEQFKSVDLGSFGSRLERLEEHVEGTANMAQLYSSLDQRLYNITRKVNRLVGSDSGLIRRRGGIIGALRTKVTRLDAQVTRLTELLAQNECASNPCQNGGTCSDNYNGFVCNCLATWEGPLCANDVNECGVFAGTNLGCQNGGTCYNTEGGFNCECPANWFGIHCTERYDDCSTASNEALCGHGTCINNNRVSQGEAKFDCLCHQGWTKRLGSPACDQDIDECAGQQRYPCSQNPPVICVNLPGTVHCGPCPTGYSGDGFRCTDINECEINNGGCSLSPRVDCQNTIGSRICGSCPTGFVGDGTHCTYLGVCASVNNGGCHPMASCIENPAVAPGFRECRCPSGYSGNGVGPSGCLVQSGGTTTACVPNPCAHGVCALSGSSSGRVCLCYPGYTGENCEREIDECSNQPCQNGGTCVDQPTGFFCICSSFWQGPLCEQAKESCGGRLEGETGSIVFPSNPGEYSHGQNCAWVIATTIGKVLNITFERFHLETSQNCQFDFLQLHDGDTAAAHQIGRYCGDNSPGNGAALFTTRNQIYMWFHSDNAISGFGFQVTWSTTDPVCGGNLPEADYGSINSPGYPGRYPHSRDCYWTVQVPPGKRIQFQMATLNLESHPNCSFDFLQIRDGLRESDPVLATFCNTQLPPPVQTSGSFGWLHFHSDATLDDQGFHITYSGVPGVPGCGGLLTSHRGTVISPNFPDPYQNKMECDWLIRVHPQERIELTFSEFQLEYHTNCQWDFIEVYDGENELSGLRGRYCGGSFPPPFISTGNKVFIKFRSDSSNREKGFKASYITACGGIFTGMEGVVSSPFYPDPYPSERACRYEIVLPPGNVVHLQFLDFNLEDHETGCPFDYLEILDSGPNNGTVMAHLCGTGLPEPLTSSYNRLVLKFVTDATVQNRGFQANYSSINVGCGGVLTDNRGTLSTPIHPAMYPPSTTCNWILRAPIGYVARLSFSSFVLEDHADCQFDYVQIQDGDGQFVRRFCGTRRPPDVTSTGNELLVSFVTDSSVSREGFEASYSFLDATHVCGGNYMSESGFIRSPRYPQNYAPNRDCTWVLHALTGHQIHLNITKFQLEEHQDCNFDFLEIRNGASANSPLIGKFCGETFRNDITSHSNALFLHFHSDTSLTAPGFEIEYDATISGCGGLLTAPSGSVVSPNYPEHYSHNAECTWSIQVAEGSKIAFVIVDVDIESHGQCKYDYLKVFDGPSAQSPSLVNLCTGQQNPGPLTVTSNKIYIKFVTDSSQSGRGFHLSYHTLCNVVLEGKPRGAIESPNFPGLYPHNFNCSWTIQAPRGNNVSITFSHLTMEDQGQCQHDFVEVFQLPPPTRGKPDLTRLSLAKYCGNQTSLPPPRLIQSNRVLINFISDGSVASDGFRLEYAVQGCGGELQKPWGQFDSPNYPNGYPHSITCEWHLIAPPGQRITLTISNLDIEHHDDCSFDSLKVYEGSSIRSPLLNSFCGKEEDQMTVTSQNNRMLVVFNSDVILGGKGFRARFYSNKAECGGYLSGKGGKAVSPNYPNTLEKSLSCEWRINVDKNHRLQITFENLEFPIEDNCTTNFLKVYDSLSTGARKELNYCQTSSLQDGITTDSNYVVLILEMQAGDGEVGGKAFAINYQQVCGAVITVNSRGEVRSPGYPHNMNRINNCTWLLQSDQPDGHVTLTFTYIVVVSSENCSDAYIELRDGQDDASPLVNRFCGNRIPSPVTSYGNSFYLRLQNMAIFRAIYSASTSACGGELTALEGTLNSPNFPDSYPPSTECAWTLRASPGNKVQLSFSFFDIEQSDFCNTDFVEVRRGGPEGARIGRYCGPSVPTNASSNEAEVLWILFRSDEEGTASGFQADYILEHGVILEGTSGQISSPLYPNYFYLTSDYSWSVGVPDGFFISFTFSKLEIESWQSEECTSFVQIYDGPDATFPGLQPFCGNGIPEAVTTTTNQAFVVFSSTGTYGHRFLLNWNAAHEDFRASTASPTDQPGPPCGEEIFVNRSQSIIVTSPNFPGPYNNDQVCTWILLTSPTRHVNLFVTDLDVEGGWGGNCPADSLDVYDAEGPGDSSWSLQQQVCGRKYNFTVSGNSSSTKLVFRTDGSVRQSGFKINLTEECGSTLYSPRGYIRTEDALRTNNTLSVCRWLIKVRPGRTIRITFEEFNIVSTGLCTTQYIQIRNGGSEESPFLGEPKYCGQNIPSVNVSSSNKVIVTVKTKSYLPWENNEQTPIFVLKYEEVSLGCGGQLRLTRESPTISLTSPGFPRAPPHDVECRWTIMSPASTSIRFDLDTLMLNSSQCQQWTDKTDFVDLYDGGTEHSSQLAHLCNNNTNSVHTTGNILLVRFVVGHDTMHSLFRANITISKCGGIITRPGEITSPGFPQNYENNLECEWKLTFDSFLWVINLVEFKVQDSPNCTADFLQVREGDRTGTEVAKFCGEKTRYNLPPAGNPDLYLKFKTDANTTDSGFRLLARVEYASTPGCQNHLTTPSGTISTPGFPEAVTGTSWCFWHIAAPIGRRVSLVFSHFNIPADPVTGNCIQPLRINGAISRAQNQESLCGSSLPTTVESTSNELYISFNMRHLAAGEGFQAHYNTDLEPFCGGEIALPSGQFSLNRFNALNVTDSVICPWKTTQWDGSANKTLVLVFHELRLGNTTDGCAFGSLYISRNSYDYRNYWEERICGNFSGTILRRSIPFQRLSINIHNNRELDNLRLNASYYINDCGGEIPLPSAMWSPGYPNSYTTNMDCVWLLKANYGEQINITMLDFEFEGDCSSDYVLIRNGGQPSSPEMVKYCRGSTDEQPRSILSMDDRLLVEFHSDPNGQAKGFNLTALPVVGGCGGMFHRQSYTFSSPSYPNAYPANVECQWNIQMSSEYRVNITFESRFEIEQTVDCDKDYLLVEERWFSGWQQLTRLCGHERPTQPLLSNTSEVRLTFRSNDKTSGSGFQLTYKPACGGILTTGQGILTSPGFPGNYADGIECHYILKSPNEEQGYLSLEFQNFTLENCDNECACDSLSVYSGSSAAAPLMGTYCGDQLPPAIKIRGNLFLVLKTDFSITNSGFRAIYGVSDCGGYLNSTLGVIQSPHFPMNYLPGMNCVWNISVDTDKVVELKFMFFSLEGGQNCPWDSVLVLDGYNRSSPTLGRFCGSDLPGIYKSSGNSMMVVFKTDGSGEYKGFKAAYRTTAGEKSGCGGLVQSSSGTITYPSIDGTVTESNGNYETNLDCIWRLVGDPDHILSVSFNVFDLEKGSDINISVPCPYDFLEMMDGLTPSAPLINRYCGEMRPTPFRTTTNFLWVHFHSDGAETAKGFELAFSSQEPSCGGRKSVTKEWQTLSSPGYPSSLAEGLRCRWYFELNLTTDRIEVQFGDFNLPCGENYLDIYQHLLLSELHRENFAVEAQPHRVCGIHYFQEVLATGSLSFLLVTGTGIPTGNGFQVQYRISNCSRRYSTADGIIYSPSYPLSRASERLCNFTIQAPIGFTISLYFIDFMITVPDRRSYQGEDLGLDRCRSYLRVIDGTNSSSPILANLCGYGTPFPIFSSSNELTLKLNRSASDSSRYAITYTTTRRGRGCGGPLRGINGTFTSPFYPSPYNVSASCIWRLTVPGVHTMTLRFVDLALPVSAGCQTNYVEVFEGRLETQRQKITRYCGQDQAADISSQGNQLLVKLVTDTENVGRGFKAIFRSNPISITKSGSVVVYTPQPTSAPPPTQPGVLDLDDEI